MKKATKVFWISFGVYSLLTLIGSVIIELNENNLGFLINMKSYISLMKYYTFIGLVFFCIAFIAMWRSKLRHRKNTNNFETDIKALKATIFDLQGKKAALPPENEADKPVQDE